MDIFDRIKNKSIFYCNGSLEVDINLFYQGKDGNANIISLPKNKNASDYTKLIENSYRAPFGKGTELVFDDDYRFAFSLPFNKYCSTFDPYQHNIMGIIEKLLSPSGGKLQAKRDKLNIYIRNGHFKEHQDTPKSSNMIGTLVVCLPSPFEGGNFVLKRDSDEIVMDWSKNSSTHIQWIAFYGDLVHQVERVTAGNRLTITYSLYTVEDYDIPTTQLLSDMDLKEFGEVLKKQYSGETVGFGCEYMYGDINNENIGMVLKGNDAIIYNSLKKLGFNPRVERVIPHLGGSDYDRVCDNCDKALCYGDWVYCNWDTDYDLCNECVKSNPEIIENEKLKKVSDYFTIYKINDIVNTDEEFGEDEAFLEKNYEELNGIEWLIVPNRSDKILGGSARFVYGNNPASRQEFYMHCVFLVDI